MSVVTNVSLGDLIVPATSQRAGESLYPILSMTMKNGLVDQGEKFKKRIASKNTSNYKVVERGQLVVGFPIDEGVLSFQQLYDEAIVSPAYGVWDVKSESVTYRPYLERFLRSPRALSYYVTKLRSTTARRRSLDRPSFLALNVPLPSLEEQRRITAILDKVNAIRRKRQQALTLADDFLRATFLDMFGDPVVNPKGWDIRCLGELAENVDSFRVPVKKSDREKRQGAFPYYGSVGVIDTIDEFRFEGEHLLISEDGKHLESRTRPISCVATGQFWVNNHAHVLKSNGKADLVFLNHLMMLTNISNYITGIDQIKLNRNSMDRIPIYVPPMEFQIRFRQVCENLGLISRRLETFGEKGADLFDTLSQRAFQGKL